MPRLRAAPEKLIEDKKTPLATDNLPDQDNPQLESLPHPGEEQEPFEAKEETPPVEKKVEPKVEEEDASTALQKQIEALKKSEAIHKARAERLMQEREEAMRRASEHEAEVGRSRKEILQSQHESISTALGAAKVEAESAQRDIKRAITDGDVDAQVDAQRRLARAEANITRLEDGVAELESHIKSAPPPPERQTAPTIESTIDGLKIPEVGKDWLREHPEFLTDQRLNRKIQVWHDDAIEAGHKPFGPEYMEYINIKAGFAEPKEEEAEPAPQPKKAPVVSAPVSREAPSQPGQPRGKVTLNALEREAAKMAGITDAEYAKQKQRLAEMRANGSYGEQR